MPPTATRSPRSRQIRIWDLPTRLFHWLLAGCVIGAIATAQIGGLWMDWHVRLGITTLFLLAFRLVWGFVGPYHARFGTFVRGPGAIRAYLGGTQLSAGHSPLAAVSVLLMLLAILVQVVTGLFATDGILIEGPLASWVSPAWSDTLTGIHQINRFVVVALVVLHLLALVWYGAVRRQPLVRAMITGNKPLGYVPERAPESDDDWRVWLRGVVVAAVVVAALLLALPPLRGG